LEYFIQKDFVAHINEAFKQDDIAMGTPASSAENTQEYNVKMLDFFVTRLKQTRVNFEISLADYIFGLCSPNMEGFTHVPGKYRMTNKEKAKDASNFIPNILLPMSQFFQNKNTDPNIQARVRVFVINKVYDKFVQMAETIIKNEEKTSEVLNKYKGEAKGGNQISDFDKMKHQFYLDNLEIQKIAKSNNAVIENFNEKRFSS